MSFGNVYENEVLEYLFPGGGTPATPETNLQIALSRANPLDDGSGLDEPSGGNYARVVVANTTATWGAAGSGSKSNDAVIAFNEASASWGTITHFAIFDNAGTQLLVHGALNTPKAIAAGESLRFNPGDLTLTLD